MRRLVGLLFLALAPSACFVLRDDDTQARDTQCVSCHGSADNFGEGLAKSAPPVDLRGLTDVSSPGVGAHQRHVLGTEATAAVACERCHEVPVRVDSPGHNDSAPGAEVRLSGFANPDGGAAWSEGTRTCLTACHGAQPSGVWTAPRSVVETCGSCHALPPPAPHPQAPQCHACHGEVIDAARAITAPTKHVNGTVEAKVAPCNACHGQDDGGAPPVSLDGGTSREDPGVGAHQAHLAPRSTFRPVACADCHRVPATPLAPGHLDGVLQVALTGAARGPRDAGAAWSAQAQTCTAWCHAPSTTPRASPVWTSAAEPLGCDGCHGAPPPSPHPQVAACALCHGLADGGVVDAARHVDGVVQASVPTACNACHGSAANAAPPRDTQGRTEASLRSVGAHQSHLAPQLPARKVACGDCHLVPATVFGGQHLDGTAQVTFSGVAASFGFSSTYAEGRCTTYCHQVQALLAPDAGGPPVTWTALDGSNRACTACHGLPPPPPHVARADCEACHLNVTAGQQFTRPETHVDGVVTLTP